MYWIVYYQQLLKWKKHSYWFSLIVWQTGRSSMIWPVVKDMNVDIPDTLVQFRPFSNAKNEMQTRSRVGFSDVTVVENYPLNKVKSLEVLKIGRREYFYSWFQIISLSDIFPVILSVGLFFQRVLKSRFLEVVLAGSFDSFDPTDIRLNRSVTSLVLLPVELNLEKYKWADLNLDNG